MIRKAAEAAIDKMIDEQALAGKIYTAFEAAEAVIRCHRSYFCNVADYEGYEQSIRRPWYTYRWPIVRNRGKLLPNSYAALSENEADRILKADRASGRLEPTPTS